MSKDAVLPREKVVCQSDRCEKDESQIKHEERALVGLKRNGEHVRKAFMHEKCYNMHSAKPLRDRFDDASKFELREVRYEISPDRQGFSSSNDIMGEITKKANDVADAIDEGDVYWLDQDIKLFIDDFLSKHGIFVHPKVINDVALGLTDSDRQKMLIGQVAGDTSTDNFKFECLENIKKFDFVMVVTEDIQACDTVLAQVDEVTKRKDGSMVAEANIIGYKNDKGMLKKLRATISPGSNVYKASQEIISDYLDLNDEGLNIGVMENDNSLDVLLNPDDLLQHIAIIAKTGYGKSFSTGVIIEEMLSKDMPVVVIDPHGEYHTMREKNDKLGESDQELYGIEPEAFSVKTYTEDIKLNEGEKLKLDGRNLEYDSLKGHFSDLTSAQSRELRTALRDLQDKEESYDLMDIIDRIAQVDDPNWILIDKLELIQDMGIYTSDESEMLKPDDLVEGGQLTIINLKGTDPDLQKTIAHLISRELFEEKKYGDIPPFVEIVEEAHNFIPGGKGSSQCAETLSKIASEGRKFGMGLGVISQRPAKIDSDVLSQCKMQVILRVTNPQDLKSISKSFENVTPQVQNHITGLAQGNAIVLGNEYPLMTEVRNRKSKHGGTGHSFEDQ